MSSFVVGGCDGFKSLLTCGVPDLKLDGAATGFEGSDLEVNSNSWEVINDVPFTENIVGKTEE